MTTLNQLVKKLNECVDLVDEVKAEYKGEYDSEGYLLWGINDKLFILIKSQLKHLIQMLEGHELDIR